MAVERTELKLILHVTENTVCRVFFFDVNLLNFKQYKSNWLL